MKINKLYYFFLVLLFLNNFKYNYVKCNNIAEQDDYEEESYENEYVYEDDEGEEVDVEEMKLKQIELEKKKRIEYELRMEEKRLFEEDQLRKMLEEKLKAKKVANKHGYFPNGLTKEKPINDLIFTYDNGFLYDVSQKTLCYPKFDSKGSRAKGTDEMKYLDPSKNIIEESLTVDPLGKSTASASKGKIEKEEVWVRCDGGNEEDDEDDYGYEIEMCLQEEEEVQEVQDIKDPNRRLSFSEIQEQKMQARLLEAIKVEVKNRKFRVGSTCEDLVCTSCLVVVEEFANAIYRQSKDPKKPFLEDVFEEFCDSKSISNKLTEIPNILCNKFQYVSGYKEYLLSVFEPEATDSNKVDSINHFSNLIPKTQDICKRIGACTKDFHHFSTDKIYRYQEQWDDKCFVCQAFADAVEARLETISKLTEQTISAFLVDMCARLNLPHIYNDICLNFVQGKLFNDIIWLAKIHGEAISNKKLTEIRFSDSLCQEINYCEAWLPPDLLKKKQTIEALKKMEVLYS